MAAKPRIIIAHVDGSGTEDCTPTVKPYQFSKAGLVHVIESNVPKNSMLPLPSLPDTTLPATVMAEPLYSLLGPPASNVGVWRKLNDALMLPCPKLQIAKTGFVTD